MMVPHSAPRLTRAVAVALILVGTASHAADRGSAFERAEVDVTVPDVTLINQEGREVRLREIVNSDKPVCLDFIFATCTTICPILSAGYSSLQRKLGDNRDAVHLVSVTIDPEHDGPEELRDYLARYRAKPGWDFLTGSRTDIDKVMRAFGAFIPDKMSHKPLIFIKPPHASTWVQIHGFASSADLLEEIHLAGSSSAE